MDSPVVSKALTQRLQSTISALQVAGTTRLQQRQGNPYDVEIERFGNATAYLARALPGQPGWWNRIVGFDVGSTGDLDRILHFFRRYGIRCYLDMDPASFSDEIGRLLAQHGLRLTSSGTVVYGEPSAASGALPEGVEVRRVGKEEVGTVAELWASGFEIARDADRERVKDFRMSAFEVPEHHLYIAYVDGTPAAMAGLFIHEGVGLLSVGGTLPAFRKRGLHSVLTRQRIADAADAGCDLVMGWTGSFASVSQNNMERAGLRIAYTMMTWVDENLMGE